MRDFFFGLYSCESLDNSEEVSEILAEAQQEMRMYALAKVDKVVDVFVTFTMEHFEYWKISASPGYATLPHAEIATRINCSYDQVSSLIEDMRCVFSKGDFDLHTKSILLAFDQKPTNNV